jgi:hypothetical protein
MIISRRCAVDGRCHSFAIVGADRSIRIVAVALTLCGEAAKTSALLAITHGIRQHVAKRLLQAAYPLLHIGRMGVRVSLGRPDLFVCDCRRYARGPMQRQPALFPKRRGLREMVNGPTGFA